MSQEEMHEGTGRLFSKRVLTRKWWEDAWKGVPEGWDGEPLFWKGNALGALLFVLTGHIDHWLLPESNKASVWIMAIYGGCVALHFFIKLFQKGNDDGRAPDSRPGRMFVIIVCFSMFEFCMVAYISDIVAPGWFTIRYEFVAGFAAVMIAFVAGICTDIHVRARKQKEDWKQERQQLRQQVGQLQRKLSKRRNRGRRR